MSEAPRPCSRKAGHPADLPVMNVEFVLKVVSVDITERQPLELKGADEIDRDI